MTQFLYEEHSCISNRLTEALRLEPPNTCRLCFSGGKVEIVPDREEDEGPDGE